MEQQNGYFQITWNDTTAVCHLFAPKAKGVPVSYKELASFLDDHGVIGYKEKEISDAIAKGVDQVFYVGQGDGLEFAESMEVHCSLDGDILSSFTKGCTFKYDGCGGIFKWQRYPLWYL